MITDKTIDVTVPWEKGMEVFPGDPEFFQEFVCLIDKGDVCNVSRIGASAHVGTHVDAPLHYINGGKDISQVPLTTLIGPCQVIEIKEDQMEGNLIPKSALPETFKHERVLFKTYNSKTPGKFRKDETALTLEAAQHITKSGVKLIGTDSFSVETFGGDGSIHRELLGKETVIIETLNLSQVQPGDYNLMCLPIKIVGGDAAPARTLLTPI